jgi:hypothetical protein
MMTSRELRCAGWLTLSLPGDWQVEQTEDCLSLFRRDGVGVLQLSTYHAEKPEGDPPAAAHRLLSDIIRENAGAPDAVTMKARTQHGAHVAYGEFDGPGPDAGEQDLWRVWCFTDGAKVILVSYLCDPDLAFREAADVENIVRSIRLAYD